jgi:hypothetical protein
LLVVAERGEEATWSVGEHCPCTTKHFLTISKTWIVTKAMHVLHIHGAAQKFGEFKQGTRTSCMPFRCQMWLAICFVHLCANSCQAERTCY